MKPFTFLSSHQILKHLIKPVTRKTGVNYRCFIKLTSISSFKRIEEKHLPNALGFEQKSLQCNLLRSSLVLGFYHFSLCSLSGVAAAAKETFVRPREYVYQEVLIIITTTDDNSKQILSQDIQSRMLCILFTVIHFLFKMTLGGSYCRSIMSYLKPQGPDALKIQIFKKVNILHALCYKVSSAGSPGIKHIIISVAVVFESANQGG